jgi:hypothetical protein
MRPFRWAERDDVLRHIRKDTIKLLLGRQRD